MKQAANENVEDIVLQWEKLRGIYNAVLFVEGAAILQNHILDAFIHLTVFSKRDKTFRVRSARPSKT